jgi:hypothetical protein
MDGFPSLDLLANNFIKAYFTTLVYRINNLDKFYHPTSVRSRNGTLVNRRADRTYARDSQLYIPVGATLTIINHTVSSIGPNSALLVVTGTLETPNPPVRSSFVETFVLLSEGGKIWISNEVLQTIDDQFFAGLGSDQFYDVVNEFAVGKDAQKSPRAPRPKSQDPQPPKPAKPPPPQPEKPPPAEAKPADEVKPANRQNSDRGRGGKPRAANRFVYVPNSGD